MKRVRNGGVSLNVGGIAVMIMNLFGVTVGISALFVIKIITCIFRIHRHLDTLISRFLMGVVVPPIIRVKFRLRPQRLNSWRWYFLRRGKCGRSLRRSY